MAVLMAVGRLIIPVLIQQILDKGIIGPEGFNLRSRPGACARLACGDHRCDGRGEPRRPTSAW